MRGFRAWHTKLNRYLKDDEFFIGADGKVRNDSFGRGNYEEAFDTSDFDNGYIILEQDTGVKDNKGKKIYDGDVIHKSPYFKKKGNKRFVAQEPYRNPLSVVEWDDETGAFHENEYEDGEFQIGGFLFEAAGEWESLKGTEKNVIEVIGNIHENPELLEG